MANKCYSGSLFSQFPVITFAITEAPQTTSIRGEKGGSQVSTLSPKERESFNRYGKHFFLFEGSLVCSRCDMCLQ